MTVAQKSCPLPKTIPRSRGRLRSYGLSFLVLTRDHEQSSLLRVPRCFLGCEPLGYNAGIIKSAGNFPLISAVANPKFCLLVSEGNTPTHLIDAVLCFNFAWSEAQK